MNPDQDQICPVRAGLSSLASMTVEAIAKYDITPEDGEIDLNSNDLIKLYKEHDNNWNKILFYACYENDINLIKLLFKQNVVDVNYSENIEITYYEGNGDFAPQNFKVPCQDKISSQALEIASKNGNLDIVKFLVEEAGAKVRHTEETALFQAAENGHLDVVKYLIKAGACSEINHYNNEGLLSAAKNRHLDVVKYLVSEAGVEVGTFGNMPLQHAVNNNDLEMIKYLCEAGANNNINVNDRCLMHACKNGYLDIVKILVESGFSIFNTGRRLLGLAVNNRHFEIIRYLVSVGADVDADNVLCDAAYSGDVEMVKFLVESPNQPPTELYGASLGVANIHAWNDCALDCAARNNKLEMVKYLINEAGIDIHTNNNVVLRTASAHGYLDLVKFIIGQISKELIKTCIYDKPNNGKTSLELAIASNHTEIIEYLSARD